MKKFLKRIGRNNHRNTSIDWYPSDSEKRFNENLKSKKNLLEKYNWIDRKIKYNINKFGFRSNNFNEDNGIIFLGCSYSFGVGLQEHNIWPFIVSNHFNKACWNLSCPGGGLDSMYRIAREWIPKINADVVCLLVGFLARREYWYSKEAILASPPLWNDVNAYKSCSANKIRWNTFDEFNDLIYNLYIRETSSPIDIQLNTFKNLDAIKHICYENNCKLYIKKIKGDYKEIMTNKDLERYGISEIDNNFEPKARDLMHYGEDWHQYVSSTFIKELCIT